MKKAQYAMRMLKDGKFSLLKTVYWNLRILPFKQAVRLPIIVSRYVKFVGCKKGSIIIGGGVHTGQIQLGFGGSRDLIPYNPRNSYLEIQNNGVMEVCGKASFAPHFSILINDAVMKIGNNFSCNNSCVLSCVEGIEFGEDCLLGGYITIRDSDGHKLFDLNADHSKKEIIPTKKKCKIGNHVWICSKCDILKGVTIADNTIVGYGSLCTKSSEEQFVTIAGRPARVVKRNVDWDH